MPSADLLVRTLLVPILPSVEALRRMGEKQNKNTFFTEYTMKQWMKENWAKIFVRVVFIGVAGAVLIPHMVTVLEAREESKIDSQPVLYTDSILVKAELTDFNPRVVASNSTVDIVINSFLAVTAMGDTVTQNDVDEIHWVLDYHTQPLKVVLLCRTYDDGWQVTIGEIHIPYDVYRVITKK